MSVNVEKTSLPQEESSLRIEKLTFWEAVTIVVGANIGAGCLSLAYASKKAGWPILLL